MLLTITLNPSIDRRYSVNGFEKGKIFRTDDYQYTPGGKGINVAKVIKAFDEPVVATGFLGGRAGGFIKEKLDEMNITSKFVSIKGETRSCIAILSDDGSQTEILESGPIILKEDMERFYYLYERLIKDADVICASGSLPRGLDVGTYKVLIELANKQGKKFILDTSGEALEQGIEAKPFLIKPNKEELESLIRKTIYTENDVVEGAKSLINRGINIVAISLGGEGSLVFTNDYMYRVRTPKISAINPVGSGDSMIAGFAVSIKRNYDFEDMLRLAAACGTANAMEEETGKVDLSKVNKLMNEIIIEKIRL